MIHVANALNNTYIQTASTQIILPFSFKAKVLKIENKKADSEFYQLYFSIIQLSVWTELHPNSPTPNVFKEHS